MENIKKTLSGLLICMLLLSGVAFAESAEGANELALPEFGVTFQFSKEREQAMDGGQYVLTIDDTANEVDRFTYIRFVAYYMTPKALENAEYTMEYLYKNGMHVYDLIIVREDLLDSYAADADATVTELGREGDYIFQLRKYAVDNAQEDAVLSMMTSDAEKIAEWAQFSEPTVIEQQAPASASMDSLPMEGAVDIDGQPVPEDVYSRSTLTMVNIWGTFCSPCIAEMPYLGELSREYEAERFQIVGVVSDVTSPEDDNVELAKTIIEGSAADYLHVIPSQAMLYGPMASMQYVPTTLFINANGEVVGEPVVGGHSKADWQTIIEERLAMAAPAVESEQK
ncbi:MAG TPA: TlpA disulfide reductase family protein [Clostridia bacterium]|nr:TlpA disulfide reductase family protein [Clostridia bacterium]